MEKQQQAAAIRLDTISKTFQDRARGGEVQAVRPLNLEMKPGELTTLLGPSGCGKTTLLRMVAGFEEPTTGQIFIGGQDQTRVMANKRDIGFVFQNYALFPHMTIFENVSYGLKLKGMPGIQVKEAVKEVLDLVGLSGMEKRFPNQISGGEQQRVALARVIVTRPRVLLFDEPLSNLDAKRRVQMRVEIKQLQKLLSITSLYVTHDQEEALAISDRIVVMNKGTIEQVGTPEEIYSSPQTVFVANFVGKTNVLPVKVTGVQGEIAIVTKDGETFEVARGGLAPESGGNAFLLIRPEAVRIAPLDTNAGKSIPGTIKLVTYLGEKVEYDVEVQGQELKAVVYDPQRGSMFVPGEKVAVVLPENRMSLVDR